MIRTSGNFRPCWSCRFAVHAVKIKNFADLNEKEQA
jgi:hypothetical protein